MKTLKILWEDENIFIYIYKVMPGCREQIPIQSCFIFLYKRMPSFRKLVSFILRRGGKKSFLTVSKQKKSQRPFHLHTVAPMNNQISEENKNINKKTTEMFWFRLS